MSDVITVRGLQKTYKGGLQALRNIDLSIHKGEIFALLGPNGAGKTTLISAICGIVRHTAGSVTVGGYDIVRDYRQTRALIGLVPQELHTDAFETVLATVNLSRGLFGKPRNREFIEKLLRDLSLWDKRNEKIMRLSGGMKRRVLIAKALSHEPEILFLDEPTAGVDVELRKDMWRLIRDLRDRGVTIILTTHYIDEAEEMADRVGFIRAGEIVLVRDKHELMKMFGHTHVVITLTEAMPQLPAELAEWPLELSADGLRLSVRFHANEQGNRVPSLLKRMVELGIGFSDIDTERSSLEDIFVQIVSERKEVA